MADNNEQSEEERRASRIEKQLGILKDTGVKDLHIASVGLSGKYGPKGESATIVNYLRAMADPSEQVSKTITQSYALMAQQALESGENPYDMGGISPRQLLKNNEIIYRLALQEVPVGDVLGEMGIEGDLPQINSEQRAMLMKDFKNASPELYNQVIQTYLESTEEIGMGEAFTTSGKGRINRLEEFLMSQPVEQEGQ